jgi:hypothetical protein
MTGRDVLYMLAALAALLLAVTVLSHSSPCYESPRLEESCPSADIDHGQPPD